MQELTERQRTVLRFIEQQIAQNGFPPTIREIGTSLGIRSTNGVNDHLKSLQRKGYIFRQGQKSRTLKLMKSSDDSAVQESTSANATISIPLFLDASTIKPSFQLASANAVIPFPSQFFFFEHNAPIFAIKVSNTDRFDEDIREGDWLFAEQTSTPRAGNRVLLFSPTGLSVRRYSMEGDKIRLAAENNRGEPIIMEKTQFDPTHLLGIVLGIFRRYE